MPKDIEIKYEHLPGLEHTAIIQRDVHYKFAYVMSWDFWEKWYRPYVKSWEKEGKQGPPPTIFRLYGKKWILLFKDYMRDLYIIYPFGLRGLLLLVGCKVVKGFGWLNWWAKRGLIGDRRPEGMPYKWRYLFRWKRGSG